MVVNIFPEHDLNIRMIFGIKAKTHTMYCCLFLLLMTVFVLQGHTSVCTAFSCNGVLFDQHSLYLDCSNGAVHSVGPPLVSCPYRDEGVRAAVLHRAQVLQTGAVLQLKHSNRDV